MKAFQTQQILTFWEKTKAAILFHFETEYNLKTKTQKMIFLPSRSERGLVGDQILMSSVIYQ